MYNETDKIILKGIGGFYYVKTTDCVVETRAKGIFRKEGITPVAGDIVEIEESNGDYVISGIHDRKNLFLRPPAANVDLVFLVVSTVDPLPNRLVLDKLTAIAEKKGVRPVLLITKTDIEEDGRLIGDYQKSGFDVIDVRRDEKAAFRDIKERMKGRFSFFSGNSGTGKSTLLNDLFGLRLEVAKTSKKLGRGKHTTRAVEMFECEEGYFADTPGFSAVDIERSEYIAKDELQYLFIDIEPFAGECRYSGCSHLAEPGCAVIGALEEGKIVPSRYESYRELYRKADAVNEWELKKDSIVWR